VSNASVSSGDIVMPGEIIGYSGQDKYGNIHLHYEVRPQPVYDSTAKQYIKSTTVINPLTFFSSSLLQEWAPIFTGSDYLAGDDSLSLGYYVNKEVQP
jgi:murein DD-endopeptidase MepM/ murein hydrolase activator NlpD